MRLLGVVLVWAAILCAVGVFIAGRDRPTRTPAVLPLGTEHEIPAAATAGGASDIPPGMAGYTMEITPTFTPVPDPFALPGDPLSRSGLVVSKQGRILYTYESGAASDAAIEVTPVPGLEPGLVEYLVEAAPDLEANEPPRRRALRVRLLHHGAVVAEETFWSEPGGVIRGVFRIEIEEPAEEAGHGG